MLAYVAVAYSLCRIGISCLGASLSKLGALRMALEAVCCKICCFDKEVITHLRTNITGPTNTAEDYSRARALTHPPPFLVEIIALLFALQFSNSEKAFLCCSPSLTFHYHIPCT